jgi:hypothetical protein
VGIGPYRHGFYDTQPPAASSSWPVLVDKFFQTIGRAAGQMRCTAVDYDVDEDMTDGRTDGLASAPSFH